MKRKSKGSKQRPRFGKAKDMNEEALEKDMPDTQMPGDAAEAPDEGVSPNEATDEGLAEALKKAQAQSEEYLNLAQRVQADFDNFRRRNNSVRQEAYTDGQCDIIEKMLPVIDNLERALAAAGEEDSPLKSGVDMVLRAMLETLAKDGVESIDRKGEVFDPNLENAVMQASAEEGEPGTVCDVMQKGYCKDGRVLRHAMVKVVAG